MDTIAGPSSTARQIQHRCPIGVDRAASGSSILR